MLDFGLLNNFAAAFAFAYRQLAAGQQAILRRADRPATLSLFWVCWQKAEAQVGKVEEGRERLTDVLAQLIRIRLFDSFTPSDDREDTFGAWLARGKPLPERRVEALLTAQTSQAVIDDLQALASFKKTSTHQAPPPLHLGSLVSGIFGHKLSSKTAQKWADEFFQART